jgi:hypothetical protein
MVCHLNTSMQVHFTRYRKIVIWILTVPTTNVLVTSVIQMKDTYNQKYVKMRIMGYFSPNKEI